MENETIEEIINSVCDIWGHVPDCQRDLLRDNISIAEYKKGEVIYNELEHPSHFVFLVSGKVKIHKEGFNNRCQIVRVIKPTGMFGFRAYFAGQEYETTATAFEPSTVAFVPLDVIERLILSNPDIAIFFVRDLSKKLGDADQRTINLTQKHVRGRLAEALLFLKDSYGVEEDGCTLCIHVSREELANISCMTTSNAIRTLTLFANEGLITINGREVSITDEEGLRGISRKG